MATAKTYLKKGLVDIFLVLLVAYGFVGLRAQAQTTRRAATGGNARPLNLNQTHYQLRAGERVPIAAPQETLDFVRNAKSRSVTILGAQGKGLVVGPNVRGDEALLAASLTMKPGEYAVTVSAVSGTGEERAAAVDVTLDPMQTVPLGSTEPPVVLLNGLQLPATLADWLTFDTCPVSSPSDTFGPLATQLMESPSSAIGNP
jgi:hypothetical protein